MPKFRYKVAVLRLEDKPKSLRIVRITPRGSKVLAKFVKDEDAFSLPDMWLKELEEWLNLVGDSGWEVVSANMAPTEVTYLLKKQIGHGKDSEPKKEKEDSLADGLMKKVIGSTLKI